MAPAAQAASSSSFKVLPDERTNSIIAAGGPLQMKQIRELIAKLDIRSPDAMKRIHVYRLKNAAVSEMIRVLGGLLGGGAGVSSLSPQTGKGSLGRGSGFGGAMNSGFGGGGFGGSAARRRGYGGSSFGRRIIGGGGMTGGGHDGGRAHGRSSPSAGWRTGGGGMGGSGGAGGGGMGGFAQPRSSPIR